MSIFSLLRLSASGLLLSLLLEGCAGGRGGDAQEFQTLFDKGRAYLERGNAQMALPPLQQANLLQPGNPDLLRLLGLAYDQVERPVQALESLEEARRLRPGDEELNNNLGVARLRVYALSCPDRESAACQKLLDQAEEAFQAALRVTPLRGSEGVWFNLALLHKQRGQWRQMLAALEKSLEISGQYLPARLELAEYYREMRLFDLERQQLRSALAAHPDHVVVLERLVDALLGTKEAGLSGARPDFSPGEVAEIRLLLSRILSLAPGTEAAQRASQRIILLDKRR
ncbi:MAG: tetratricopeptide repeat protein [Magnetococcus sp. XQGC-1]